MSSRGGGGGVAKQWVAARPDRRCYCGSGSDVLMQGMCFRSPSTCTVGGCTSPLSCQGQGTEAATQSRMMQVLQLASCRGARNVGVLC